MKPENPYCVILTTCPKERAAQALAQSLVENGMAACVHITGILSFYRWRGELNSDTESLLIIKTKTALYDRVQQFIRENHEYEVPEIVRIAIDGGLPEYLGWMDEACSRHEG
ncbi:MAG: divalent-cation tolerance protein CutA [Desulfomonilia bacterium]